MSAESGLMYRILLVAAAAWLAQSVFSSAISIAVPASPVDLQITASRVTAMQDSDREIARLNARIDQLADRPQITYVLQRRPYAGIGATITAFAGVVTVVDLMPGSPAARELRRGDHIIGVDRDSTSSMTVEEVSERLRGVEGSSVTLVITREPNLLRYVTMIRAVIR